MFLFLFGFGLTFHNWNQYLHLLKNPYFIGQVYLRPRSYYNLKLNYLQGIFIGLMAKNGIIQGILNTEHRIEILLEMNPFTIVVKFW